MTGIDDCVEETILGHQATVAALVLVLDELGIVPKDSYCDVLHRLWQEMPEEVALGEAGAVIERALDFLGAGAAPDCPSEDSDQDRGL